MAGEKVRLTHTGPQIDAGIDAALNPDTVPEADSDALITSDAVAKVQQGFAPIENAATAANAYAIGDLLVWEGVLYKAKAAIAVGDSFTVGTNIETTTVADKLNNIDSQITTNTDTTISGLLKGSSGKVAAAVGDADYATPAAVTATRQMLAPILSDPAGQAVSAGDYFIYNGTLYKALQAITSAMTAATFTGATYSEAVSGGGLNALKSAIAASKELNLELIKNGITSDGTTSFDKSKYRAVWIQFWSGNSYRQSSIYPIDFIGGSSGCSLDFVWVNSGRNYLILQTYNDNTKTLSYLCSIGTAGSNFILYGELK